MGSNAPMSGCAMPRKHVVVVVVVSLSLSLCFLIPYTYSSLRPRTQSFHYNNTNVSRGFLRVQNATIFPKNVHFFATLLGEVAKALNVPVGDYTHFISSVCHDRSATQC